MHPSTLAKRGNILLLLALIAFYFYGLGHLPLIGPDEPRYAQVAREMFLRGDLITPTLGGHLWFEKPALFYWLAMASYKLFGVSEWSARLPATLCGLLTIAAVPFIGKRLTRATPDDKLQEFGFWATLAAGTSLGIAVFSRAASFDILLTMATTWALAFFIASEFAAKAQLRRRFLVGLYTFVGVSLLAKGLIGIVLPAGIIGIFYLFRWKLPRRDTLFTLSWGIPLALAIAAIWYAPVIVKHGWPFVDQFFIQHHFSRYLSDKYRHHQPVYYYVAIFPLLILPWTLFLFDELAGSKHWRWRERRDEASLGDESANSTNEPIDKLRVFAFAWLVVPLVFFSFSSSKLPGYILPALPAGALLAGERLIRLRTISNKSNWAQNLTAALCLIVAMAAPLYAMRSDNLSLACGLLIAAPLAVAGCYTLLRSRRTASALLLAGATVFSLLIALNCVVPRQAERESSKRLIELADNQGYSQAAIFGMQRADRTPEFYAAGRIVYGGDGEPVFYDSPGQVIEESRRRDQVLLTFVPIQELRFWNGLQSVETKVIGDNGKFALMAVRIETTTRPVQ